MADWFDGTMVKVITGANFEDKQPWKLRDKRCAFVLFFAEWCGHCANLKPEYIKFADLAGFMRVHAIDTETESTLMEKLGVKESPVQISGFPTVWIYRNGEPYKEYSGARTWQGLLKEAKAVCHEGCTCDKPKRRKKK